MLSTKPRLPSLKCLYKDMWINLNLCQVDFKQGQADVDLKKDKIDEMQLKLKLIHKNKQCNVM